MKVKVSVKPVSGKPREIEIEVPDGATLEDALKKADVGTKGFNFFVNGEPADLGAKLDATVKVRAEQVQVTATERVAGS